MAASSKNAQIITKQNASKIIGIQFSIMSPEEIRNSSVAEIISKEAYVNNKPVINGLFDPRMGVLEPGMLCPTDGLDYVHTPGYFGHINLARPVFYIQYLNSIHEIIRTVCIKCSKLLICKRKYNHFTALPESKRWDAVYAVASAIKRCGEDTDDGCGCKQPLRIKKEGFSKLVAEWEKETSLKDEGDNDRLTMTLTPEILLKCFKRISDDDVSFMGFSPIWSRPEWMICQVLAVPPPAVRPSVKHDSQQRSEDDLTHIIINIIKTNQTLQEKIVSNSPANIIDDWISVLQYYIAVMIDNKIPGMAAMVQRSGRPLKSIKDRMVGKHGRVRGNLMGKRVDQCGRSVITPDPNLSATELGVPIKMARNLTKPVVVNDRNIQFLEKLVQNGPDVHPGAKNIIKVNGDNISLRYIDRKNIILEPGDIVHRHMMDGDCVLFNRQPTLHRMSMMGHIVRVMPIGDTFRMNVADTKPYNADFDGDEMNLHMPQDNESEAELRHLAAVPWQIISPANNKPIIGIFQDSMLGSYRFSRPDVIFDKRTAMNLLMSFPDVNPNILMSLKTVKSFDILSQILPPVSLFYKTKQWDPNAGEDIKTSHNVLEINNGRYVRGQMDKSVLGDGSHGLIHRICNDYGNKSAIDFIDNLQNIITEYMKISGFSVGVSDLISSVDTINNISKTINDKKQEVRHIIDQLHLGIFKNKTGRTNAVESEIQINNILSQANEQAGKIGRKSLSKDNRFVTMVNAGSKGSDINISQMISCLGQQNVENKRIQYGFEDRTLPHFTKFDDSPPARGFVENSFISGLTPEELFFHAMSGRIGIIDTAVKTSQTGYIQRRLIKGLEDLKVEYDMTVRNNMFKIIQYTYGEDGFDPVKIESQHLPIVKLSLDQIYAHYQSPIIDDTWNMISQTNINSVNRSVFTPEVLKQINIPQHIEYMKRRNQELIDKTIEHRANIARNVFNNVDNSSINMPVAFSHIIDNVCHQQLITPTTLVDISPMDAMMMIDAGIQKMVYRFIRPNPLFTTLYYYYMNTNELLIKKRFGRNALEVLINQIILSYNNSIIAPGEMVGMIAAQSIGEPTTQMTLNTFHFAGVASKSNVTRGIPRIEEIITLSKNPKNPSCTIYLKPEEECSQNAANNMIHILEHTHLRSIVKSVKIIFDPCNGNITGIKEDADMIALYDDFNKIIDECNSADGENANRPTDTNKSRWIIRMVLNKQEMHDRDITTDDVNFALNAAYTGKISCVFSDYNNDNLIFRIRPNNIKDGKITTMIPMDQSDEIHYLQDFQESMLDNLILRGVRNIKKVTPRKILHSLVLENGKYEKKETWVLDTVGTNLLHILSMDNIDVNRSYTNDIQEIYKVLGIEAARQAIFNEISEVIEFDSTYINYHHLIMLCDRMTCNDNMVSIFRHGINNDNIGPIAKASFEETPEMFLNAAKHAEVDIVRGVSANVMCGQEGYFGTSAFQVILDYDKMSNLDLETKIDKPANTNTNKNATINAGDELQLSNPDALYTLAKNQCSIDNLTVNMHYNNTTAQDFGEEDEEYTI